LLIQTSFSESFFFKDFNMQRKSQLGLTGTTFGCYRIDELIGSGGMAAVYKAFDMRLDRHVAVKVLPQFSQTDEYIARFQREAKAMARLFHPNIVSVHDFGQQDGNLYLVMDFIRGGTLEKILVGHQIPYLEAVNFLLPVVNALGYAHEQGVIHRDVKPANILLDYDKRPVLSDFGIAKINLDDDVKPITRTGAGIGTPDYMAPEQGLGRKVDGRADIYSLGVIFYEMLVGEKPYSQGKGMQVMMMHIMDPFPLASVKVTNLPKEVEQVMLRMVEKEASDRYPSMEELRKALLALEPVKSSVSNRSGLLTEESMFLQLGKRKEGDTICPVCSSAIYEGDRYCSQCGEKLTDDTNEKKDADRSILKRSKEIIDAPKIPSIIPAAPEIGSGLWYLTVITGTRPGREYVLQDRMVFGRNESNAVWVNNNNASRQHAMIEKIDDGYQIRDMNSTNGTWVNGKRIEKPIQIKENDQIVVGDSEFKVVVRG